MVVVAGVLFIVSQLGQANVSPTTYEPGDRIPIIQGQDYGSYDRTLILYLNSGCRFCTESMTFYRAIADELKTRRHAVQVVAIAIESEVAIQTYLTQYGVRVDKAASVTGSEWSKLRATPTILIVDHQGIVEKAWVGKLPNRDEADVRTALGII